MDLIWFAVKTSEFSTSQKADGGMENGLRRFALYMSYISFFLRIFVALVFWKDSLDFDQIIANKGYGTSPRKDQPKEETGEKYVES